MDGFFASRSIPVLGGGLSPFYHLLASDHAAVWCSTSLFVQPATRPLPIKRLQLGIPGVVQKYLDYIRSHWHEELDDAEMLSLMEKAERSCRRLKTGGLQYSPELSQALVVIRIWRLRIKRKEGGNVSIVLLRRMEKHCDLSDGALVRGMSLEDLKRGLVHARDSVNAMRKTHIHLQGLSGSSPGVSALLNREQARAVFRRLLESIPTKTRRPLYMVKDTDGSWQDTKADIYHSVAAENVRRFTQTRATQMRTEPLRSLIGVLAETTGADEVLTGTLEAPLDADPTFIALLPFTEIFMVYSFRNGW